jgi:hypothetical protein
MRHGYQVQGSLTVNAAATKDFLSIKAAANQRLVLRSLHFGHDAAVSAQGVAFQVLIFASGQTDVTGTAFTPIALDQGDSRAALSSAKATVTANASGTNKVVWEVGFDILSPYNKTWQKDAPDEIAWENSQILVVRKITGADTTGTWRILANYEE